MDYSNAGADHPTSPWAVFQWPAYAKNDPEQQRKLADQEAAARDLILNWASPFELKASDSICCPRTLLKKQVHRCSYERGDCFFGRNWGEREAIFDHCIGWRRGRQPVAFTTDAYRSVGDMRAGAQRVLEAIGDPRLAIAVGTSWYPGRLPQVVFYRADLLPDLGPARPVEDVEPTFLRPVPPQR
ncbi:hypothetical protein BJP40_02370 [Streptomyces sp. CC53]|nr:hypothetical protein BJP40_02370 [Streptomyces sp. CC53]